MKKITVTPPTGRPGIIFDFDGVLADTEPLKFAAYVAVFKQRFNVEIVDDVFRLGKHEAAVMEYYLQRYGLRADVAELMAAKRQQYWNLISGPTPKPIPGALEFLKMCHARGYRIGIATMSDRRSIESLVGKLGLRPFVHAVQSVEDVKRPKPHPEIYLKAAALLGLPPADCVAVEDSPTGVEAAHRAGLRCVAIATGATLDQLAAAEVVVRNFSELTEEIIHQITA